MRLSLHAPLAALGLFLAVALGVMALAPAFWLALVGAALFSLGLGTMDTALNGRAAHRFGAREVSGMHAGYGVGATIGPAAAPALLGAGFGWLRCSRSARSRRGSASAATTRPPRRAW